MKTPTKKSNDEEIISEEGTKSYEKIVSVPKKLSRVLKLKQIISIKNGKMKFKLGNNLKNWLRVYSST